MANTIHQWVIDNINDVLAVHFFNEVQLKY